MASRKVVRPDDGRIKANKPPSKRDLEPKSRYQMLKEGIIGVADLDDDEIRFGRCKDKNGNFSGRPPNDLPKALHDALHNEFIKRTEESFKPDVELARGVLRQIALNERAAAPARVTAAMALIERGAGKVTDKVQTEITVKPFEEDLAGILVDIPDELEARRKGA